VTSTGSVTRGPGASPTARWRLLVVGAVLSAALVGALSACASTPANSATAAGAPASVATAAPQSSAARGAVGANQDPYRSQVTTERERGVAPVRVRVPSIGVDSGLESLSRDSTGWIQPPVNFDSAGWYSAGVVPGDIGPAVIAGHIDSAVAPAVFARLIELQVGAEVQVTLSDQSLVTFTVDRVIEVAKAQFPTDEVYGPTPTAQLRLITCGGVFDDATGHYVDNLVVFATRTE
jgi:sortase (surface protein transpeptidase)